MMITCNPCFVLDTSKVYILLREMLKAEASEIRDAEVCRYVEHA